ncbi:hypothetical protein WJX72_011132 [[Myrmecia] bisecta]|uniref:Uncharacterized protein n=1 Tax=[Myrmecia] bisecta TaxID=41462 RepID=A0AAW1R955_9CHLO
MAHHLTSSTFQSNTRGYSAIHLHHSLKSELTPVPEAMDETFSKGGPLPHLLPYQLPLVMAAICFWPGVLEPIKA